MANAEQIISALGGRNGKCKCPAHDDRDPSLSVSEQNGKVLVKCHAGCSQDAVINALRARGLWYKKGDKSPAAPTRKPSTDDDLKLAENAKWMKAWHILRRASIYSNENPEKRKEILGRYFKGRCIDKIPVNAMLLSPSDTERLIGKRFPALVLPITNSARRLQGAAVTLLSKDGSTKLAIDKPKRIFGKMKQGFVQLGVIERDGPLVVGEGIETVLSAKQIARIPAALAAFIVTNKDVELPHCAELIVAGDNDGPGRLAASAVAEHHAVSGRAGTVRVAFPPGVNDWNDALRKVNRLPYREDRLGQLKRLRERITDAVTVSAVHRPSALTMEEVMGLTVPPREYLMKPWLATGAIAEIHAKRGSLKTRLGLSIAYAIATGNSLLNWEVHRTARVLYVDGELPTAELQQRLTSLGPATPNLLMVSREIVYRETGHSIPDLGEDAGRAYLDRIIKAYKIEVIVLDSLSTLVRCGDENDAEGWVPIQDWLMQHRFRGRSTIFIHHEGKSGQQRGTSKREDVLDTAIKLKEVQNDGSEDASTYELSYTKTRGFYGVDAKPLMVRLTAEDGIMKWSYQFKEDNTREKVMRLLKQGYKQSQIAKEVDISAGRVSQIVKEATKQGREVV